MIPFPSLLLCMVPYLFIPFASSQLSPWYNFYRQNEQNNNMMTITNGILPTLSCPYGYYRDFDKGIMLDGCVKCPLGRYGNSTDLKSPNCTAPCPIGTYLDRKGGKSIDDCIPCPEGTFGEEEGLANPICSGRCEDLGVLYSSKRYHGVDKGLTSRSQCKVCQTGYNYYDCEWEWPKPEHHYKLRLYLDNFLPQVND